MIILEHDVPLYLDDVRIGVVFTLDSFKCGRFKIDARLKPSFRIKDLKFLQGKKVLAITITTEEKKKERNNEKTKS